MNAVGGEEAVYIAFVLTLYADLPDTPTRPSPMDQSLARRIAIPVMVADEKKNGRTFIAKDTKCGPEKRVSRFALSMDHS